MSFRVEVWGDYACFSRPEMKVERVSYDVMTPSAARGLLDAVYWHPGFHWVIDRIHVCNPIRFTNIRRNEVDSKIMASNMERYMRGDTKVKDYLCTSQNIQQRAAMVLRDVRYVIDAHFELVSEKMAASDNEGKFCDIMRRRLEKGQCYHQPCFGVREFPASFRPWVGDEVPSVYQGEERDLGYMLYDLDYSDSENITPLFFRAVLKDGVLDLRDCEVVR